SAVAESSRILSRARGEAGRLRAEAQGYSQTRVSRARGESARFLSVLAEYRRQPVVFQQRLLRDTFESVLPNVRTYILDSQPGDPTTNLRIIESERGGDGGN
ncbi:MAG: hypothetical protein JXO22_05545, partial [Phycisphaerae bacterium]|nr:hypothetical protein [Phycisphaerae bacterium]